MSSSKQERPEKVEVRPETLDALLVMYEAFHTLAYRSCGMAFGPHAGGEDGPRLVTRKVIQKFDALLRDFDFWKKHWMEAVAERDRWRAIANGEVEP